MPSGIYRRAGQNPCSRQAGSHHPSRNGRGRLQAAIGVTDGGRVVGSRPGSEGTMGWVVVLLMLVVFFLFAGKGKWGWALVKV